MPRFTRILLGAVIVVSFLGLVAGGQTPRASSMIDAGLPPTPFGPNAPWNRPVAGLHIASNSITLVSHVWDGAPWPGQIKAYATAYTYPVYDISGATTQVPVRVTITAWGSNLIGTTIPWNPKWLPSPGPDSQVILVDPPTGREWDLWQVAFDGATLTIANGNLIPGNYWTKEDGFAPSRGAGIEYQAMLVRPSEVEQGVVAHALSMPIVRVASSHVSPALKSDGVGGSIPMGTRFALNVTDADIDAWLNTLPLSAPGRQSARVLAVALRDYGMFVTDNGGGPAVQFEDFRSSQSQWQALGLGSQSINGRVYPRDLFDGLINPNRLYALTPSNLYPPRSTQMAAPSQAGSFSVGNASVLEGDRGARTLSFPVTLSHAATAPVSVNYIASGVTATGGITAGTNVDFKKAAATLTFVPSRTTGLTVLQKTVSIPVYADTSAEPNETVTITLFGATGGYSLRRSVGGGTILNDDVGTGLRVGVGDAAIVESDTGKRNVSVPVTLSAPPGLTVVTIPYTVHGVSATSGSAGSNVDFGGATSGTLTFTGTATSKAITIPIYGDLLPEADETIQISLGSVTGAIVIRRTGTITMLNDD